MTRSAKVRAIREMAAAGPDPDGGAATPFRLRPLIEAALSKSRSADPGDAARAVLMRIPVQDREAALEAAVRMCCYVVSHQAAAGDLPAGTPTDF